MKIKKTCPQEPCRCWGGSAKGAPTEVSGRIWPQHSCPSVSLQPSIWFRAWGHKAGRQEAKLDMELGRKSKLEATRTSALTLITSNQNNLQSAKAVAFLLYFKSDTHFPLINSNSKSYRDSGKYILGWLGWSSTKAQQATPWKLGTCVHLLKPYITSK